MKSAWDFILHQENGELVAYILKYIINAWGRSMFNHIKFTKKIVIGAAVAAALAAVGVFVCVGCAGSSYKKTAKEYAQAVLACDWGTVYDLVGFPECEFLTKEAYKEVHFADRDSKTPSAIAVTESQGYLQGGYSSGISKDVKVTYSIQGESQSYMDLSMYILPEKYMLFFNQYKVNSNSLISKDVSVKVPCDSRLIINGVEVSDKYKVDNDAPDAFTKMQDEYKIPYIFNGKNRVKVTGKLFRDYETLFSVDSDGDEFAVLSSKLDLKGEIERALTTQAESDLKMITDACVANKDINEIADRISNDDIEDVKENYEYSLSDCHSSDRDIVSLVLSDIKTNVKTSNIVYDADNGNPIVYVAMEYKMHGTCANTSSPDNVKLAKGLEESGYIKYKYVDGKWMIYCFSLKYGVIEINKTLPIDKVK